MFQQIWTIFLNKNGKLGQIKHLTKSSCVHDMQKKTIIMESNIGDNGVVYSIDYTSEFIAWLICLFRCLTICESYWVINF